MVNERFDVWQEAHQAELAEIRALLDEKLPDEAEPLWTSLQEIEAQYGRLQYLVSVADGFLDLAEAEHLPKTKTMTALEKEVEMKAACVPERQFRDLVQGLLEAVKVRIMLGQSRMAYMRELYIEARGRGNG